MEDGLWGVTKEGDRRVTDVPLLHIGEVASDIPSDGGLPSCGSFTSLHPSVRYPSALARS